MIFSKLSKYFPLIILGLFPVLVAATIGVWEQNEITAPITIYVFLANFVYFITLITTLLYTVVKKISLRRYPDLKSSLYLTLTRAFAYATILPAVMVAIIASLGINIGLRGSIDNEFFDQMQVAGDAVNSYFDFKTEELRIVSNEITDEIQTLFINNINVDEGTLRQNLQELQIDPIVERYFIINNQCEVISRGNDSYIFYYDEPPVNYFNALLFSSQQNFENSCSEPIDSEENPNLTFSIWDGQLGPKGIIYQIPNSYQLYSVTRISLTNFNLFLYVSIGLIETLVDLQQSISDESTIITGEFPQLLETLFIYSIILLSGGALLIFIAVPQGLIFANRISKPVINLAVAARKIGEGNLKTKFSTSGSDEIAFFSRIFKEMVEKLDSSINKEISTRNLAESREREFREVLTNVTSGVIGLDTYQNIIFINDSAMEKLNLGNDQEAINLVLENPLHKHVSDFVPIVQELNQSHENTATKKLQITHGNNLELLLLVRVAKRVDENGILEGYVITFDDITDLVNAEQKSAWASVAQQIAHEIKNAFTPVSGALDLLRDNIEMNVEKEKVKQMEKYVGIVEESMHGLLRISKEFSEFAKLPDPILEVEDLNAVCNSARINELHRGNNVEIELENMLASNYIHLDKQLFRQVMINLLKNSQEGIHARQRIKPDEPFNPKIKIILEESPSEVLVKVMDNGIGFSKNIKLTEYKKPFVTFNKERGSGLGLAYTDRIVDGHFGKLTLDFAPEFEGDFHQGALVTIHLPKIPNRFQLH